MSKKILALLCSLLLVVAAMPLAALTAAADSSGSTNGNYALKVQTTGGHQYDGAQIDTGVTGLNLVDGTTYTFSFDLYTPDQDVAGIVLQTNKSYTWIKNTGALSAASSAWTSYTGELAYSSTTDSGAQIQFVKAGDSGATDAKNITYYIDNFVVKDASGAPIYTANFEDQTTGGFTQSGDATLSPVVPDYFLKIQTTGGHQYDGAQIDTGVTGLNLVDGTTYTFSFDLYTPDQDVAGIVLQTNKSYTWIKNTGALSAASPAWTSYTGELAYSSTTDSGAQIQFVKAGDSGATDAKNVTYYIDNFVVKDAGGQAVYTANFDDQTTGGFTQSGDATLSNVLSVSASTTPTTPPTDEVVTAYDLQQDTGLNDLVNQGGSTYLQKAGPLTIKTISNEADGTVSLDLSKRADSWHGVDVRASAIGLTADADYTVEMTGHVPDGVTIPSGAQIVLGGAASSYATLKSVDAASTFTLSYSGTAAADTGETTGLRIQADAGLSQFVIDTLIVKVKGGTAMPSKPLSNIPGVHVFTSKVDKWSGANIILGTDSSVWPFSTGDAVAFTPVKGAKYHLTFNATSTGATGYRVRWITGNDNGGYTDRDNAVVTADPSRTYQVGVVANELPASFTGVVKAQATDFAIDFTMSGSELAQGLIGNIGIRGTAGSNDFKLNSIKITNDSGNVLVNWSSNSSSDADIDPYQWPDPKWDLTLPSLKDAYSQYFKIGNIMEPTQTTDATLTAMYDKQYNVVTAENAMKPDNLLKNMSSASDLSDPSKYNFAGADQIVQWAEDNNQSIHGHTLVWYSQTPAFINTGASGTRAAAKANMETYITNVITHFNSPNFISWDVVNEAFDDNTAKYDGKDWRTGLRSSPWLTAYANGADESESGADYIYDAFVFAHLAEAQIGSTATLYYNDYNETYKYKEMAQMVEELNAQWEQDDRYDGRKLIEGIGMQSHFWIGSTPDVNAQEVETAIQRFVDTGVRISVSELDIPYSDNNNYHLDDAKLAEQAREYGTLFAIYKKYAAYIDRVTFWGKADSQSWRGSGMPLLFDNSYRPKKAFWTVMGLDEPTTNPPTSNPGTGATTVDTKDGQVTIEPKVETKNGVATAAVSNDDLTKALQQAAANTNGKKQVTVQVPAQANATSYEVQLPAASLRSQDAFELVLKTDNGTIQVPSNMLSNVTSSAANVSVRIAKADTSSLSADVLAQIGNRPAIELNVLAGDQAIVWNNPNAPVTVAIPYAPTAAELANPDQIVIWTIDSQGNATSIPNGHYDAASGKVEFHTTHFSTYAVAYVDKTFSDLQSAPWAQQAVEAMAARGIILGTSEDTFTPKASIKRADFIKLLVKALELKGNDSENTMFSDVPASSYYYDELAIAKELGIATGYGDNMFKPNSTISRQDMMVLTARALAAAGKQAGTGGSLNAFADANDVSGYAKDSAAQLVGLGIVNGKDGKIAPNDSFTRAEAAAILYRIWKL